MSEYSTEDDNKNLLVAELKSVMGKGRSKKSIIISIIVILAILIVLCPIGAKFGANKYADKKLSEMLSSPVSFSWGECKARYEGSEYNIFKQQLDVKKALITCNGEEVARFANVSITKVSWEKMLPVSFSADFYGGLINMRAKVFGKYGEFAKLLRYESIPLAGVVSFSFDKQKNVFTLDKFSVDAAALGKFDMAFSVDNVRSTSGAATITAAVKGALSEIVSNKCLNVWAAFSDDGFSNRVISTYAGLIKSDDASAKARILHGIERRISIKYKNNIFVRDQMVQLYRFVENPASITAKYDASADNDNGDTVEQISLNDVIAAINTSGIRAVLSSLEKFQLKLFSN